MSGGNVQLAGDECSVSFSDTIASVAETTDATGWADKELGEDDRGILTAEDA